MIQTTTKARFEEKFKKGSAQDCWLWLAYKDPQGYGRFRVVPGKNMHLSHRVAYRIYKGEFPDYLKVLHTCDNPSCVNPDHLYLGTDFDNAQDKMSKGRSNTPKGDDCYQAKLTMAQVRRIREFSRIGIRNYELVPIFKVSKLVISRIVNNKIYKEVETR